MIYCLDTDILIEYFRRKEKVKSHIKALSNDDRVELTWLSFYEFFKGIFISGKIGEEKFLRKLLETSLILEASYESARLGSEIYATLKKKGKLINDADILIASIVKSHKATIVTNNSSHFSRIEGLRIENWLL